jgi:type III restriction enzyme
VVAPNLIFNKTVCDNQFEEEIANLLARSKQIISFAKNPTRKPGAFKVEYQTSDGGIADYYPDFIVKQTDHDIWIIEAKGREDLEDPHKWERLKQWCADATARDGERTFRALFIHEQDWEKYHVKTFKELTATFTDALKASY